MSAQDVWFFGQVAGAPPFPVCEVGLKPAEASTKDWSCGMAPSRAPSD